MPTPPPTASDSVGSLCERLPSICDGKEQNAFEAWASSQRYDMTEHPLHWLFLDAKTGAARQGWKAGLAYASEQCKIALEEETPKASTLDADNSWRERFAEVLNPHVWPGKQYAAADAVLAMSEWRDGIVLGESVVEHTHREFGQGYFYTPDAALFLNELGGAQNPSTDEPLSADEMEATGNAPWHAHQPIEDLAKDFRGRQWVPLEAAISALQFWQRRDYEHGIARLSTLDADRERIARLERATWDSRVLPQIADIRALINLVQNRDADLRDRIQGALEAALGDTYDCTRVWSAWGYGTMGEDDFRPVCDRLDEIVSEVAAALSQPNASNGVSGQEAGK